MSRKPTDSQTNPSRVILCGWWGAYSVYHLHLGGFGFCHSVWHDGKAATGIRKVILLPATDCAQRRTITAYVPLLTPVEALTEAVRRSRRIILQTG